MFCYFLSWYTIVKRGSIEWKIKYFNIKRDTFLLNYITILTQRVLLVEQELLTLPEHLSSTPVLCISFCRSLFVLFRLAIVLSVLLFTDSDYLFKLFLQWVVVIVWIYIFAYITTYAISAYHHQRWGFESRSWWCILDTTLCDKDWQWLATGWWFSPVLPFPSPIKLTETKYCWIYFYILNYYTCVDGTVCWDNTHCKNNDWVVLVSLSDLYEC